MRRKDSKSTNNSIHPSKPARLVCSMFLMLMIFLSAVTLISFPKQSDAQSLANCVNLSVIGVMASGSESRYPASNAKDNKLNTRWSNVGLPSWIEADLGNAQIICHVDISWYRGNLRTNTFTISVSDDKVNYVDIFTGQSSGNTKSFERYDVPPDTKARYLRITVTGNSEGNNYASVSELDVY